MHSAIDKIRGLRALHEDGLLSLEEFEQRKNAILDAAYAPGQPRPVTEIPPDGSVTPEETPQRAGTEIGLMVTQEIGPHNRRYRLERLIAQGGMGQVWQATDLATHAELGHSAQVALKILPPQLTQAASNAKLLIQEATRARRLAHEHIVRVYEWAQDPATTSYFIIMEYLEGEDLDAVLAREHALSLERVLALLDPVADALDYAWERHRLVHRDIKPGNVFVTRKGDVKLLDFGIAARARAGGAASKVEAPATSGTAGYRAPEVAAESHVPQPTLDVYAVAVMIHQLLTGVLPGGAGGQVPSTLGARQWEVLRSGFAPDPARRPPTVHALLGAIRAAAGPSPQELAATEAARQAELDRTAREVAARRKIEAEAAAVAQARLEEQRRIQLREQQRRERAAAEEARQARKETLRQQLLARRDEEVAKTQAAKEEAARKLAQARATAALQLQQKQAREEEVARAAAPAGPAGPTAPAALPAVAPSAESSAPDAPLHDAFLDGSGQGPALVMIAAGRFQMGSPEHERRIAMASGAQKSWLTRETPQHWVGIERPFALGRHPVTVGEWRAFVRATGWQQVGDADWEAPGFPQTDAHPVVGVTWFDAQKYVVWLSEATGQRYRLPSEAEWEYACRAGKKTAFHTGDTIATTQANFDGTFTYNGGPRGEFRHGTTPAGMFAPNAWGLHDMHGNVWEWVQDVVHDNYEGAPIDGSAWETGGDQVRRILRGGSWLYNPRYLRAALRNGYSAVLSNDIVGFRVARD